MYEITYVKEAKTISEYVEGSYFDIEELISSLEAVGMTNIHAELLDL